MNLQTSDNVSDSGFRYGASKVEMPIGDARALYRRIRASGGTPKGSMQCARILVRFREVEDSELVRILYADDSDPSGALDWLEQTAEQMGADPREWSATQKRERERASSDGVWGLVGQYRTGPDEEWETGDSVWGFIGTDGLDAGGYLPDVMGATLDALDKAREECCPTCKRPRVHA